MSVLQVNGYHKRWVEVEWEIEKNKPLISKGFLDNIDDVNITLADYDSREHSEGRTESATHTIPIASIKKIKGQSTPVDYVDPI